MNELGILGFGTMGAAIAQGMRRGSETGLVGLTAYDKSPERLEAARSLGVQTAASVEALVSASEVLLVAVKPQDLGALLAAAGKRMGTRKIISIVAGRSMAVFERACGTREIARLMPNIAATVGESFVGLSVHTGATESLRGAAWTLSGAIGVGVEVPEHLLSAVTGVAGSGIAFALSFLNAMALGGVHAGMDYRSSLTAAIQTVRGAAALLTAGAGSAPTTPNDLLTRVTSPAGTTIEGVLELERGAFTASVMRAVKAAADRASELEGQAG